MDGKHKFPEGTLFSGENAFIPIPEALGGGFKMVKVDEFDCSDLLSDNLGAEDSAVDGNNINYVKEIKFDIDYKSINEYESVQKTSNIAKEPNSADNEGEFVHVAKGDSFSNSDFENLNSVEVLEKLDDDETPNKRKAVKNIHEGHRERLKARYDKLGLEGFEDHEVLEFLLYFTHSRCDTNPIAHALINEFGSLEKVLKADRKFLENVDGVGKQSSLLISFCHQLMLFLNSKVPKNICLADSTAMGEFCCQFFMQRTEETFAVLMLDTKRTLQKVVIISTGTENETAYYPRNVVKEVIKHKANVVVIAHNHTGNSVHPSDNDIIITEAIFDLLAGIGVPLLDHIICCGKKFTSLSDRGLMPKDKTGRKIQKN